MENSRSTIFRLASVSDSLENSPSRNWRLTSLVGVICGFVVILLFLRPALEQEAERYHGTREERYLDEDNLTPSVEVLVSQGEQLLNSTEASLCLSLVERIRVHRNELPSQENLEYWSDSNAFGAAGRTHLGRFYEFYVFETDQQMTLWLREVEKAGAPINRTRAVFHMDKPSEVAVVSAGEYLELGQPRFLVKDAALSELERLAHLWLDSESELLR